MTVRTTIRVPDELYDQITESAAADVRSVNSQIIVLIERGLGERQPGTTSAEAPAHD